MTWCRRPGITIFDLLSSCAGYGFPSDFALPAVQRLSLVQKGGWEPQGFPGPDVWMAELALVPLLYQPGQAWLYDTCSILQGVLITRVAGQPLPDFLAERVFAPLGMSDTGFEVPGAKRDRLTSYYRATTAGGLDLADGPDGQWSTLPQFPLGNGVLAGTADDWLAFGRMLLAEGAAADGRRLLTADSVRLLTSDRTTQPSVRSASCSPRARVGVRRSVDIAAIDPWNVPGRYGWVGGTGTSAHITPSTGTVAILLAQVAADSPIPQEWMPAFWRYAASPSS